MLEVLTAFFRAFNCRILYGLYLPTVILTVIWYFITHSLFLSRLKTFLLYKSYIIAECSRHHARSASDVAADDRRLLHHSSPVCSRPTHLRRLRPVLAMRTHVQRPCHNALPRYVIRFVALCRRPHFRCSWLHCCTSGWTMGTACWSALRLT